MSQVHEAFLWAILPQWGTGSMFLSGGGRQPLTKRGSRINDLAQVLWASEVEVQRSTNTSPLRREDLKTYTSTCVA